VINAYTQFLKYVGLTWEPPNYTITQKIPFIPTEQEIDDLIAGLPNIKLVFVQLLKETAMRSGEAINLPWKDVDLERSAALSRYYVLKYVVDAALSVFRCSLLFCSELGTTSCRVRMKQRSLRL